MSLRRAPTLTPARVAASRANAKKSTGPRTREGKARAALNALKHGRYAERLPETLVAAGHSEGAELYWRVRREIEATFGAWHPHAVRQVDRLTAGVWSVAWLARLFGTKLESPLFSRVLGPWTTPLFRIRTRDKRQWIGLTHWVQRKKYWTRERVVAALMGRGTGTAPRLREILEGQLRRRAFRLRLPGLWERQTYGLDEDGNPDPTLAERLRPYLERDQARRLASRKNGDVAGLTPNPGLTGGLKASPRADRQER